MEVVQVQLERKIPLGKQIQVCWLPTESYKVKQGSVISLKSDPGTKWTVVDVYQKADSSDLKRGWNNNI